MSGLVDIKKDTMIPILMERSHADVKFRLKEGSTPVNKVWVKVDEDSLLSDALGIAKFLQLAVHTEYAYSTFREGYLNHSGAFYLTTDTTIDLAMEKLPTGIGSRGSENLFKIWPNPTGGMLQLELNGQAEALVSIYDARGIKVLESRVSDPVSKIDMGSLPAGLYSISVDGSSADMVLKL